MDEDTENEEKNKCFIIKATNVPPQFFQNRDVAKKYFRRFGKVKLVMFKPKRNVLLIEYANEDSMLNALEVAGEYNGHVFNVTQETGTIIKKRKAKKDPDPDWTDDPEVKSELAAMGAFGPTRTYDLRPEAMMVDPPDTSQVTKVKQRRWKGASPKPQIKKGLRTEQSDLIHLIKQQAFTVEDKFRILDARDKLIRLKLKKTVELSKATATVGTCPDMCPEKERLMRETQHQVALYEQEEGGKGMNPRLAVKQYSRSSADQEAPLPQELRPVSVLQMTMGYLMHRIMGLCDATDVNLAEWYHFLWDRTRGIRKDITQQELCSQGSVELVEQCARFHIFCSARLVAEDPSVFDQKINTENLTKCLQTLKYMYHDLSLKGESCRNEAEFRAYIILLNLNDGNFMWEVQQLKSTIQHSKEIKFALEVYSSLDKRNYVKFFKLVNSTTFLNACILMRYFIQVRLSAVKTLLKSYSPRVSQTSLPVSYLTKILAFEDQEATIEFCETYGLYTNVERTRIILDKGSFADPEFPYVLERAINLVESKRRLTAGEVVCGKELPPKTYENHVPQNSFNSEGFLEFVPDLDEVDVGKKEEKKEKTVETTTTTVFSPSVTILEQRTKPNIDIFVPKPVEKEEKKPIFSDNLSTSKSLWTLPPATTKTNIFGNVGIFGAEITRLPTLPVPVEITKPSLEEQQKAEQEKRFEEEEEEKRRKKEEEEKQRLIEEEKRKRKDEERRRRLLEEQEKARRLEEARRYAEMKKKMEEEAKKLKQERRKNIEIKVAVSNLLSDLLDIVEDQIKTETLTRIKRKIKDRRLRYVVTKWRENTRRKRKRKAIDFNPLWFAGRSLSEEAQELQINNQNLVLSSIKRYKRGKPSEIQIKDDDIGKIDLCELTYKLLIKKFMEVEMKLQNELFWKVTISLPNEIEFGPGLNHTERVLDGCIKWEKRGNTTVMIQQSKSFPTVTYCLEKQKGFLINSRNDTNGFIFIAKDFNDDLSKRIVENFRNYGVYVKIPIVLVLQSYNEHKSELKNLIQEGIISDYLILVDKFTSRNLVNIVEEALIFLSTKIEKSPPLEMDTLKSFLTKYLCNDLWKRANSFAKWNTNYKACLKNPNTVIYLHNEALDRLKKIILDENCHEYSTFPQMFKEFLRSEIPDSLPCDYKYFPSFWNNDSYIRHVANVLDTLKLPNFLENWPPSNQLQLELGISKYCTSIVKEPQKLFYKTMSVLLRHYDPNTQIKEVENVVWSDIVEVLVLEKLNQTNFSLYGTGFVNKSVFNQLIVVYNVNTLNEYAKSDWFYISNPVIKQKVYQLLQESEKVVDKNSEVEVDVVAVDIDELFNKITQNKQRDVSGIKNDLTICKRMMSDLEETVVIHKRILERSGQILKTIIEEK